jgi:hypothetical protein
MKIIETIILNVYTYISKLLKKKKTLLKIKNGMIFQDLFWEDLRQNEFFSDIEVEK